MDPPYEPAPYKGPELAVNEGGKICACSSVPVTLEVSVAD